MLIRRTQAAVIAFTLIACFGVAPSRAAAEAKRPNIVFIFADDHAYQAVGAYGGYLKQVVRTPNIDKLAGQGTLFRRCMVTNSICGPMRAVIQTGKYSHLNGFIHNGNRFNGDQQTFPKLLRQSGYQTAVIGKWHLGEHQAPQGYDYSEVLVGQGPYYNPVMLKDADGSGENRQRTREQHTGYTTDIITDLGLVWLDKGRDKDKPFMLMLQHKAPHREWSPKPEVYEHWKGVKIPEPPTLLEDYAQHVGPRQRQEMSLAKHFIKGYDDKTNGYAPNNLNPEQKEAYLKMFAEANEEFEKLRPNMTEPERVRWMHQRYARIFLACIESIDINVGRVLKYLDDNGLADNTVVIYSSDQGFYIGEHGWYDKRWVYEQSLKTPLVVRWPGVTKPGTENGDIVCPLDFAQTFLQIAGVDQPADMQGRSLVPVLKGHTPDDWRKSHYYHYYEYPAVHMVSRHYAVCTDRYKLIRFYGRDGDEWELIDLDADPLETKNFYDDPAYAKVRQDLHAELDRLRRDLKVPADDDDIEKPRARLDAVEPTQVLRIEKPAGESRNDLDPSGKPFTVGARVTAESGDGVIVAQGGGAMGFTLYLKDRVPTFAVRSSGQLATAAASEPITLNTPVHLAGQVAADGTLRVLVDGKPAGSAKGFAIASKPAEPLSVGADTGDPVGEYKSPMPLKGKLTDLRLYWGEPDAATIKAWIGR